MTYSVSVMIPLEAMARFKPDAGTVLSLILDDMRVRIEHELSGFDDIDTRIRPWPTEIGESFENGYDKLVPRMGINIILTTRT